MKLKVIPQIILCFLIVFISGCNSNSKLTFLNDMDMSAWVGYGPINVIHSDNAHSGKYVCKLDATNSYSPTFYVKINNLTTEPLKSMVISAWVFMKGGGSDPSLVADIRDKDEKPIEWLAQHIKDASAEKNSWIKVVMTIDLTQKGRNNPENFLRVYALNNSPEEVLVDDLEISLK